MAVETPMLRPQYAARFHCIGGACEDSCCAGWTVTFDEAACGKYQTVAAGPLRVLLDTKVVRQPLNGDGTSPRAFAKVQLNDQDVCPFLNEAKLCQIQSEYGEGYLSRTCATYPRVAHSLDGLEETTLSLSCPEAARLVLLSTDLLQPAGEQHKLRWDLPLMEAAAAGLSAAGLDTASLTAGLTSVEVLKGYFWQVREFVVQLLRNRDYALWQRLFLLGVFARQLDELGRGSDGSSTGRDFVAMLGGFQKAIELGGDARASRDGLCSSMDAIAADLRLQLDLVLQISHMRLPRTHVSERFLQTLHSFEKGIGVEDDLPIERQVRRYGKAYERYYEPFFDAHPEILENLLINAVFRTLYPYGLNVSRMDWKPAMERQFCLLVVQFALMKGLLIGVAGAFREKFGAEQVVFTVQTASKHFEHHPSFLERAEELLVASRLNDLRGMTMLVRN